MREWLEWLINASFFKLKMMRQPMMVLRKVKFARVVPTVDYFIAPPISSTTMSEEVTVKVDSARLLSRAAALGAHIVANSALYGGSQVLQLVHGKRKDAVGEDLFVVSAQVRRASASSQSKNNSAASFAN
jgi:hypothetical protein